jgi:hypothetical protein
MVAKVTKSYRHPRPCDCRNGNWRRRFSPHDRLTERIGSGEEAWRIGGSFRHPFATPLFLCRIAFGTCPFSVADGDPPPSAIPTASPGAIMSASNGRKKAAPATAAKQSQPPPAALPPANATELSRLVAGEAAVLAAFLADATLDRNADVLACLMLTDVRRRLARLAERIEAGQL